MIKYNIFYKNIKIGVLQINEKKQYKYTPEIEGTNKVKNEVSLIHEMLEESDWREPIPFFKNRIENAERFGKSDKICVHTDDFKMERFN